jgi:hypothetical protein
MFAFPELRSEQDADLCELANAGVGASWQALFRERRGFASCCSYTLRSFCLHTSDVLAVADVSNGASTLMCSPFVIFQTGYENLTAYMALGFRVTTGRYVVGVGTVTAFATERRRVVPPKREVRPYPTLAVPIRAAIDLDNGFGVTLRDADFGSHFFAAFSRRSLR